MDRIDTDRRAATVPLPPYLEDESYRSPEFTVTALSPREEGGATYIVTMSSVGGVHSSIQTTRVGVERLRDICNTVLLTEDE